MGDTAFTDHHTLSGQEQQRRLQHSGHGGASFAPITALPLNADMAPTMFRNVNNIAALAGTNFAVSPVFPHVSGLNTDYQLGSQLGNSQPSSYLPLSLSPLSLHLPFQNPHSQVLDPTNIPDIPFAPSPRLQNNTYNSMEIDDHLSIQDVYQQTRFSGAISAESADFYEETQRLCAIQPQVYDSIHTPTTPAGSSATSPYSFQNTPQIGYNNTFPQLVNGMVPTGTHDRSYSQSSSWGAPDQDFQPAVDDPLFGLQAMGNREFADYQRDSTIPGIGNCTDYPLGVVSNPIGMTRTNSRSRSATSDHSCWQDGSPLSSISSAIHPTGSPSNNGDPRQYTGQNLKRGASDAALETGKGSQPTSKRSKSGNARLPCKACLACYLAHKTCAAEPGSESCKKCSAPDSQYPVCVSSSIKTKDFFTNCLSAGEKSKVEEIKGLCHGLSAAAVLSQNVGREIDLKLMMEELSEYKMAQRDAYAVFFEDHSMKNHPIFGPFYQVNLILQARLQLHNVTGISHMESDLLVLRAICASRLFRFIEKNFEKNKQPENMPKGSQRARNFVVFLAISLEQILAYETTTDIKLESDHDKQRTDLVYHLAYLLRHISKATFPNSTLSSDIHIGPNNEGPNSGVHLKKVFWDHLRRLYVDTSDNNTDGGESSAPKLIISPPTNQAGNGTQMSSADVSPVGIVPAKLARKFLRRRDSVDNNDDRDNADASSLLEARVQTEESAMGQLISKLDATHISHVHQEMHYYVGRHTSNTVWDSGLPSEASGRSIFSGHGDGGGFGIGTPGATGGIVGAGYTPGAIIGTSGEFGSGMGSFSFRDVDHTDFGASYDIPFGMEGAVDGALPAANLASFSDTLGIFEVSDMSGTSGISGISGISARSDVPENIMRGHVGIADGAASARTAGMADADSARRRLRRRLTNGKNKVFDLIRRKTGN